MRLWIIMLCVSGLMGCAAGMDEQFSCSDIDGITGCVTMNDVNTMIENGRLGKTSSNSGVPLTFVKMDEATSLPSPKRSQEIVQEMVIFPFIDSDDNYHGMSKMYVVINQPAWSQAPHEIMENK